MVIIIFAVFALLVLWPILKHNLDRYVGNKFEQGQEAHNLMRRVHEKAYDRVTEYNEVWKGESEHSRNMRYFGCFSMFADELDVDGKIKWIPDLVEWVDEKGILQSSFSYPGSEYYKTAPYTKQPKGYTTQNRFQSKANDYQKPNTLSKRMLEALAVLELQAGATYEEVKAAYRRMVQTYHPDKVAHKGEEFVKEASKIFTRIQEAYEYLQVELAN